MLAVRQPVQELWPMGKQKHIQAAISFEVRGCISASRWAGRAHSTIPANRRFTCESRSTLKTGERTKRLAGRGAQRYCGPGDSPPTIRETRPVITGTAPLSRSPGLESGIPGRSGSLARLLQPWPAVAPLIPPRVLPLLSIVSPGQARAAGAMRVCHSVACS